MQYKLAFLFPAFLISTLSPTLTFAADELDAITVTADFRPTTLEDSTVSVSVVTEDELKKRGAEHIEDTLNLAPNVNMASGASRSNYIQIRGIGERSQFVSPINPSVGMYIDGMDFSRSGSAATMFDVDQVEIIRGPQGTNLVQMHSQVSSTSRLQSQVMNAKVTLKLVWETTVKKVWVLPQVDL